VRTFLSFLYVKKKKIQFLFLPSSFELLKGLLLLLLLLMVVLLLKNKTLLSDVKIFGCFFSVEFIMFTHKKHLKNTKEEIPRNEERKKSRWHFARGFLPKRRFLIPTKMKGNLQITYLAQMEPKKNLLLFQKYSRPYLNASQLCWG
jgi:hypothetical protein